MDYNFQNRTASDNSVPPPPGVDNDDHNRQKFDSRSRSRDYDRDRSRHDRGRDSRSDRDDHSKSYGDRDYRDIKDSSSDNYRSRNKSNDSLYDRRSYRDRSHDRDRIRDRAARAKDRNRDRYCPDREHDFRDDIPSSTILVKGIPPHISEDDIRTEINRFTLNPMLIVIHRKRSSPESQGSAFIEFHLLSDAVRWKELTQGVIYFGQVKATIHYFMPRNAPESISRRVDWACLKCGVNNFRKRQVCFKCHAPKEESDSRDMNGEGYEEVGDSPSSTLLFRNLDVLTTEERILSMLGQITVLPIKNLKVAKDSLTNTSRGFAYVELHSVSEAMQLHDLLKNMAGNFFVDGRRVTVSYSCRSLASLNSVSSTNAASSALDVAQGTNQDLNSDQSNKSVFSDSVIRERQMESVQSLNAGYCEGYQKNSIPDVSTYQYDESSGYYYDSTTGYFYDPNSQYYYNSTTREYLYWDLEKQTYMVVPTVENNVTTSAVIEAAATKVESISEAVISSPPVIAHAPVLTNKKDIEDKPKEKASSQDKVKIAKKVAKDMEKWAKTLNQKKENSKFVSPVPKPITKEPSIEIASMVYLNADKKIPVEIYQGVEMESSSGKLMLPTEYKEESSAAGLVAAYGGESDSEVESEFQDEGAKALELLKSEETKLLDWNKLVCLLCKRQFPTKEALGKHLQLSDLHKQNVNMLKLTKLTPRQLHELEKKESGYRDRAKERRQKFGQPEMPPPSRLKTKYLKERKESYLPPEQPVEAIGSDNIGNKMLKAMGWQEGQGLGKTGQGMSGIIEVHRRVKSAGLGMRGSSYGTTASDSYKDAVRKSMQARYNEIA